MADYKKVLNKFDGVQIRTPWRQGSICKDCPNEWFALTDTNILVSEDTEDSSTASGDAKNPDELTKFSTRVGYTDYQQGFSDLMFQLFGDQVYKLEPISGVNSKHYGFDTIIKRTEEMVKEESSKTLLLATNEVEEYLSDEGWDKNKETIKEINIPASFMKYGDDVSDIIKELEKRGWNKVSNYKNKKSQKENKRTLFKKDEVTFIEYNRKMNGANSESLYDIKTGNNEPWFEFARRSSRGKLLNVYSDLKFNDIIDLFGTVIAHQILNGYGATYKEKDYESKVIFLGDKLK